MDKVCALCDTNFPVAPARRYIELQEIDGVPVKSQTFWHVSEKTHERLIAAAIQLAQVRAANVEVI
jgi:hypothetical protein